MWYKLARYNLADPEGRKRLQRFRRILVPVVGERNDDLAVELACQLLGGDGAQIWIVYVIEVERSLELDAYLPQEVARAEQALEHAEGLCAGGPTTVASEILQARLAGPAIIDEAEKREAELIIIGLPYRLHFRGFDLGDTAAYILKNAECPVWLCRDRPRADSDQ